jgi:hypothetical protein
MHPAKMMMAAAIHFMGSPFRPAVPFPPLDEMPGDPSAAEPQPKALGFAPALKTPVTDRRWNEAFAPDEWEATMGVVFRF